MKKITIAILAVIYLVVSSGIAVSIHYCMGKVSSIDLVHNDEKCGKCGMEKNTGCCKNEFKIVKLSDSHKLLSNEVRIFSPVTVLDNFNSIFENNLYSSAVTSEYNNHSPPGSPGVPLTILHCVFRI